MHEHAVPLYVRAVLAAAQPADPVEILFWIGRNTCARLAQWATVVVVEHIMCKGSFERWIRRQNGVVTNFRTIPAVLECHGHWQFVEYVTNGRHQCVKYL